MHLNATSKNVSWPHFSWPTVYIQEMPLNRRMLRSAYPLHSNDHPWALCTSRPCADNRLSMTN